MCTGRRNHVSSLFADLHHPIPSLFSFHRALVLQEDGGFQHILRVMNTNLDGKRKVRLDRRQTGIVFDLCGKRVADGLGATHGRWGMSYHAFGQAQSMHRGPVIVPYPRTMAITAPLPSNGYHHTHMFLCRCYRLCSRSSTSVVSVSVTLTFAARWLKSTSTSAPVNWYVELHVLR